MTCWHIVRRCPPPQFDQWGGAHAIMSQMASRFIVPYQIIFGLIIAITLLFCHFIGLQIRLRYLGKCAIRNKSFFRLLVGKVLISTVMACRSLSVCNVVDLPISIPISYSIQYFIIHTAVCCMYYIVHHYCGSVCWAADSVWLEIRANWMDFACSF